MTYTIQVSNHPHAGKRIPPAVASESWTTVYDGPIATACEARLTANKLQDWYRHVRVFRGRNVGRLWYGNLSMR